MASLEVKTNDDDDSCSSSSTQEEFDFIESVREDDVEVGLIIRWPSTQRPLHISTKLSEDRIAPLFDGTQWAGTRVWKAAVLGLECLLEHYPDKQNLLELGCGLGVPGMLWHLIKESEATPDHEKENNVLLTDMPDLLPQLQENVQRNFDENGKCLPQNIGSIQAKALEWSRQGVIELLEQHPPFEICLNCDCIYEPLYGRDSWEALADVLAVVAETSPSTILVTSVERRRGDGLESFLERLAATGTVRPIERVLRNDEDKHHVIEIYVTQGNLES